MLIPSYVSLQFGGLYCVELASPDQEMKLDFYCNFIIDNLMVFTYPNFSFPKIG